jgi:hypothetical protein
MALGIAITSLVTQHIGRSASDRIEFEVCAMANFISDELKAPTHQGLFRSRAARQTARDGQNLFVFEVDVLARREIALHVLCVACGLIV